jgi:hypothetical protein
MKKLAIAMLLVTGSMYGTSQYYQKLWKATQLGPTAVLVTCLNGADPTGSKLKEMENNTLIVSCSELKKK